jgi:hypothetical protein
MRAKTLFVMAALGAVSLSTAMAQVYSINAVGFVNVDLPPGLWIIANPLDAGNNTVTNLFPATTPDGVAIYVFNPGNTAKPYTINNWLFGSWDDPSMVLAPGAGFWVLNPLTNTYRLTFVGEVKQGTLTSPLPAGLSITASQVPQAGAVDTALKFPVTEGDTIYRYMRGSATPAKPYEICNFAFGSWDIVPNIDVAEGFWVNKVGAATWTRTFDVNNP